MPKIERFAFFVIIMCAIGALLYIANPELSADDSVTYPDAYNEATARLEAELEKKMEAAKTIEDWEEIRRHAPSFDIVDRANHRIDSLRAQAVRETISSRDTRRIFALDEKGKIEVASQAPDMILTSLNLVENENELLGLSFIIDERNEVSEDLKTAYRSREREFALAKWGDLTAEEMWYQEVDKGWQPYAVEHWLELEDDFGTIFNGFRHRNPYDGGRVYSNGRDRWNYRETALILAKLTSLANSLEHIHGIVPLFPSRRYDGEVLYEEYGLDEVKGQLLEKWLELANGYRDELEWIREFSR